MSVLENIKEFEAVVSRAEDKSKYLEEANVAQAKAQADYDTAVAEVEKLRSELMGTIQNLFPTGQTRVRQS